MIMSFESQKVAPIEEIIAELRAHRMVILVDDEDRENEGDLILPAENVTPEAINFMVTHARGLVCLTVTEARCRQMGLDMMTHANTSPNNTAFTISIEASHGVTTGISAHDRAHTIQTAVSKNVSAKDFVQPGHVFPILAKEGGVLVRAGHTEAGCDLAQLAGFEPSAAICEILNEDGSMARLPELLVFAAKHNLKVGTIADLIHFRSNKEVLVEKKLTRPFALGCAEWTLHAYADKTSNDVHFALTKGEISADQEVLVRVHEPLSVLDFLLPEDTQHSFSLTQTQQAFANVPTGVIILMHRAEDGSAILTHLENPTDTKNAKRDPRVYGIGAQILRDLGVRKMKILATPRTLPSMAGFDLEVTGYKDKTIS